MLGHASAAMTLDVYAGLLGDDLDAVADRLDEAAAKARVDFVRTRTRSGHPAARLRRRKCPLTCNFALVGRVGLEPTTQGL